MLELQASGARRMQDNLEYLLPETEEQDQVQDSGLNDLDDNIDGWEDYDPAVSSEYVAHQETMQELQELAGEIDLYV